MRGSIRNIFERHSYDLRDKFNDARAAGASHGTLATDGVNTRTDVDTDSKLTQSDGKLNLAPHSTPAWGDPGRAYSLALTRPSGYVIGRELTADVQSAANNTAFWIGLCTDTTPGNPSAADCEHGLLFNRQMPRDGRLQCPLTDAEPDHARRAQLPAQHLQRL